jgi:ABC-type lipoprotein release transport system permease subunit
MRGESRTVATEPRAGGLAVRLTLRLAWRNLRRNRRRTWITATTVALAVMLLQLEVSTIIGIERQSMDNLISYQTGHAKVFAAGYFPERDELPLDRTVTDAANLVRRLEAIPGVSAAAPRIVFAAQLSDGRDQVPCTGIGIDLEGGETDVFRLPQAVTAGTFLMSGEPGLLVGSGLAELFGVRPGSWLTVVAKTRPGAYEALELPVVGLVGTGNPDIDRSTFFVPLATASRMLAMNGGATEIAVRFGPAAGEAVTLARIRSTLAAERGLEVLGWRDLERDYLAMATAERISNGIFLGIFVVLAVVGVANTVMLAVFERTREIGMLMALGLRGSGVRRIFVAEGAMLGLLGAAIGTALAVGLMIPYSAYGLNLTALYGEIDLGYPVKDRLYGAIDGTALGVVWLLTAVLSGFASFYPAMRASRQRPAEALRHV